MPTHWSTSIDERNASPCVSSQARMSFSPKRGWSWFALSLLSLMMVLVYTLAVLEVDPGNVGDALGDVYDTHLPGQRVDVAPFLPSGVAPVSFRSVSFCFISCPVFPVWRTYSPVSRLVSSGRTKPIYLYCQVWRL